MRRAPRRLSTTLLAATTLACLPVFAGADCSSKTREWEAFGNAIHITNKTGAALDVKFYRDSVSAATEKGSGTAAPGGSAHITLGMKGNNNSVTTIAVIAAQGANLEVTCKVYAFNKPKNKSTQALTGDIHTHWDNSSCTAAGNAQNPYKMSCSRSFQSGNNQRWKTTWVFSD